jgi:drug/metabolite transporter (DMT)-like permease
MPVSSIACAVLAAVLMGTIGIFSKITGLSAQTITFFRLMLGAAFMLIFLIATGKTAVIMKWPTWPVLLNGSFLAGFIIFYVQAMHYTSMANAIMMIYLAPLAASVIAHFFLGEKLNLLAVALILLTLFGFALMMEFKLDLTSGSRQTIGLFFGLLSLIAYAGFIIVNRLIVIDVHVFTRTFYQLLTGAIIMLPFALLSGDQLAGWHIPWLLGTGLLPGFLAILFAVIALSRMPAATFGTLAYIEPVAVIIFGWTLFHETLNPMQITGCLLIILSGIAKAVSVKA